MNFGVRLLGLLGWLVVLVVTRLLTCGLLPSCVRDVGCRRSLALALHPPVVCLVVCPATSSYSLNLPLSPSITPSLFHCRLKTYLFTQIFPTIDSLPPSGLTPRLYDWSVSSEHLDFLFLVFFISLFVVVPCGRLS